MKEITFLAINKQISAEIERARNQLNTDNKQYIATLLRYKSDLLEIENYCKKSLRNYTTKEKQTNTNVDATDNLINDYNEQKAKVNVLLERIKASLANSDFSSPDKQKFLQKINEDITYYSSLLKKKMVQLTEIKKTEIKGNVQPNVRMMTEDLYKLANMCGGVYIKMNQSYDPIIGGELTDQNQLVQTSGKCAGLVIKWEEQCTKYGTPLYPIVSKESVLQRYDEQKKFKDEKSESRTSYPINSIDYYDYFTKMGNKPIYIAIRNKEDTVGHALGLRKRSDGSFEFFDPNMGYFFFPNANSFTFWFSNYMRLQQAGYLCGIKFTQMIFYINKVGVDASLNDCNFPKKSDYDAATCLYDLDAREKFLSKQFDLALLEDAFKFLLSNENTDDDKKSMLLQILNNYLSFSFDKDTVKTIKSFINKARLFNPGNHTYTVEMAKFFCNYQKLHRSRCNFQNQDERYF